MTLNNPSRQKILVTTDFSPASFAAFPYAADQTVALDCSLEIVNIFQYSQATTFVPEYLPSPDEIKADREALKAKALKDLEKVCIEHFGGADATFHVLETEGWAADAILKYASEQRISRIVISTHGHGIAGRLLLGSVAERVMRGATCPVLIVPADSGDKKAEGARRWKNIIVTTDFSPASQAAVPYALQEAERSGARLMLAHVSENLFAPEIFEATMKLSATQAIELQKKYRDGLQLKVENLAKSLNVDKKVVPVVLDHTFSVANSIAVYAKQLSADLIITAALGTGSRTNWFGGVAYGVVRQVGCPVLIIPVKK